MDNQEYSEEMQNEDQNMVNQYEGMEDMMDEYEYSDMALQAVRSVSNNSHYYFVSSTKIMEKIDKAAEELKQLMSMEFGWCFQIYERCSWNISTVLQMFDKKVNFRELIQYKPAYELTKTSQKQVCEVCLQEQNLLINSCSHRYCQLCWTMNLQSSINNDRKLIPKCQAQNCESRMNYLLIRSILNKAENHQLLKEYQTQLVVQYSRQNYQVKVCPHPKCKTTFMINSQKFQPMWCRCEDAICSYCGQFYHFPASCFEVKNWDKMVMDQQNQWIKIVMFKICPQCKNPIQKNEGCNHMTCRCRHEFCWICLKDWRTHGVCQGREEHDRMQSERQKAIKNQKEYREKFQQCKEGTGRYEAIIKRVNSFEPFEFREKLLKQFSITMKDSEFITEALPIILVSMRFCRCCLINKFFTGEENLQSIHAKRADLEGNMLDDRIFDIVTLVAKYQAQSSEQLKDDLKGNIIKQFTHENRLKIKDQMSRLKQFLVKSFDY